METAKQRLSLHGEIERLRALVHALMSADEAERELAAAQAADVARVTSVLIRAIEIEQDLRRASDDRSETAIAAVIARSLEAMSNER